MQIYALNYFFVIIFKSLFVKMDTSVGKLSPEIVFTIESDSLSITKSCSTILFESIYYKGTKTTRIYGCYMADSSHTDAQWLVLT